MQSEDYFVKPGLFMKNIIYHVFLLDPWDAVWKSEQPAALCSKRLGFVGAALLHVGLVYRHQLRASRGLTCPAHIVSLCEVPGT